MDAPVCAEAAAVDAVVDPCLGLVFSDIGTENGSDPSSVTNHEEETSISRAAASRSPSQHLSDGHGEVEFRNVSLSLPTSQNGSGLEPFTLVDFPPTLLDTQALNLPDESVEIAKCAKSEQIAQSSTPLQVERITSDGSTKPVEIEATAVVASTLSEEPTSEQSTPSTLSPSPPQPQPRSQPQPQPQSQPQPHTPSQIRTHRAVMISRMFIHRGMHVEHNQWTNAITARLLHGITKARS